MRDKVRLPKNTGTGLAVTALRRAVLSAGTAGILVAGAAGLAPGAPASTTNASPTSAPPATVSAPVRLASSGCLLGRAENGNCRGGSINDNKRLNDALKDTGEMYKEAGECAIKGVIKGRGKFWSSQKHAAKCGAKQPHGQFR